MRVWERSLVIIAGPNGAGKTTFAREFLPNEAGVPLFVNADLIAAGLSPFAPERAAVRAGRLMIEEIDRLAAAGQDFAFETTLSGKMWARRIPAWRRAGYFVELYFLRLPNADAAVRRVAVRVRQGGHNVPEETVRRRFTKGLHNLRAVYAPLVDAWTIYDSTSFPPLLVEEGGRNA